MRITRETDCAIVAATYLAKEGGFHSASSIAEACHLNPSLTGKVLKLLAKAELLSSTRGIYGGYRLQKAPEDISLLDIMEAIDGPLSINACTDKENPCEHLDECDIAPHWAVINQSIYNNFARVSLEELCQKPRQFMDHLSMTP